MARKVFLIGMFSMIALSLGTVWAEPRMNPGMWEITTRTEMAGMPPQSMTHTQCVTNNDLVPMGRGANQECQVTDIQTSGSTVTWKISCGGRGGGMTGTGSVTYNGDRMKGTMEMTIPGSNMKVKNILSGKRIGNCTGSAGGSSD